MQNAVIKTPSPLEVMGHGKAAHEEGVIDNIERLVAAFRAKGLPVVYCVAYTPEGTQVAGLRRLLAGLPADRREPHGHLGRGDHRRTQAGAPASPSSTTGPSTCSRGPGLDEYLKGQGVDTVVLIGVATGMSVGTAAWALAERFYNLVIPADAQHRRRQRAPQGGLRVYLPGDRPGHHHGGRRGPSLMHDLGGRSESIGAER